VGHSAAETTVLPQRTEKKGWGNSTRERSCARLQGSAFHRGTRPHCGEYASSPGLVHERHDQELNGQQKTNPTQGEGGNKAAPRVKEKEQYRQGQVHYNSRLPEEGDLLPEGGRKNWMRVTERSVDRIVSFRGKGGGVKRYPSETFASAIYQTAP